MNPNSITLKTSELEVIIGNNEAGQNHLSPHRARYNGIWSLKSVHAPENCFVPYYAGLNLEHFMDDLFRTPEEGNPFEPRDLVMTLESLSPNSVKLSHLSSPLTGIESETVFTVREPHIIDMEFRARLHQPPRSGKSFGFFWASYMNAPDLPALYFKGSNKLWNCLSPDHHGKGGGNTVCHESLSNPSLGNPHLNYDPQSIAHSMSQRKFSIPLMFGRTGNGSMAFIQMFDQTPSLRLCMSPTGGGTNLDKKISNPAWDFQYIIDEAQVGIDYHFKCRTIYKKYEGREEIDQLYSDWEKSLV